MTPLTFEDYFASIERSLRGDFRIIRISEPISGLAPADQPSLSQVLSEIGVLIGDR